ncbi:DUF6300 family protein [Actinomadura violacea]|uniref:Uncharacterized protein n=1 Tax=Actinomadura violacea TaxID=2819934 RepID=A0ABS3S7H1_9ACTN|nr:DUF6300 family protein [Actinomadura violacea]MBO2464947.1 hypothetical protein [Actinomadura violacea]
MTPSSSRPGDQSDDRDDPESAGEQSRRPIDVVSALHVPACPRCGGPGLLSARVPHDIERQDGHVIRGTTEVVLCPGCDADQPEAGALITYFHVHGAVDADTVRQAADLISAWANSIEIPPPDVDQIDAEAEAWRKGEL